MGGAELLARYLDRVGKNASEFAAEAGLHPSLISRLLRGKRRGGINAGLAIERATRGAVPISAWRGVNGRRTADKRRHRGAA